MKSKVFTAQEVQSIIAGTKTMFREVIKPQLPIKCPYHVGKKIFVKESFYEDLTYRKFAGFEAKDGLLEINARSMKQEHSRLTLEITDVKVERLGKISEKDAFKEGVSYEGGCEIPRITFKMDWNGTHKKPEEKFEANPFVWVVDFKINK